MEEFPSVPGFLASLFTPTLFLVLPSTTFRLLPSAPG